MTSDAYDLLDDGKVLRVVDISDGSEVHVVEVDGELYQAKKKEDGSATLVHRMYTLGFELKIYGNHVAFEPIGFSESFFEEEDLKEVEG